MEKVVLDRPLAPRIARTDRPYIRSRKRAEYRSRINHLEQIEETLNELVELTARKRSGAVHGSFVEDREHVMHWVEFYYYDKRFDNLPTSSQNVFKQLVSDFGIHAIQEQPLEVLIKDLLRRTLRDKLPTSNVYFEYPDTEEVEEVEVWKYADVILRGVRRDSFLSFNPPRYNDSLGLVRHEGFSLRLRRTPETAVETSEKSFVIRNVTALLMCMYMRDFYERAVNSCLSDRVIYDVECFQEDRTDHVTSILLHKVSDG